MLEIDRWILSRYNSLLRQVTQACEEYQFHRVWHLVHGFCAVELSAFYLDILKDRLYTFGPRSVGRRSAQTALHDVLLGLVRMMAPVLAYTTEEVWQQMRGRVEQPSVHLADWPAVDESRIDSELDARWERLLQIRQLVDRALDRARTAKLIGGPLEASVTLHAGSAKTMQFLQSCQEQLPSVFIVSEVNLTGEPFPPDAETDGILQLAAVVQRCPHRKCERCWNLRPSVGSSGDYPALCDRCVAVVKSL
jgi:isoleucyl-tRNA synthetase